MISSSAFLYQGLLLVQISDSDSDHTESWDKELYVWGVKVLIVFTSKTWIKTRISNTWVIGIREHNHE